MTSRARLAGATVLAVLALILGWTGGAADRSGGLASGGPRWSEPDIADPSAIDAFVERVAAANLLPRARLRDPASQDGAAEAPQTAEELARLLSASDLSAFVRRGDVWRIHTYGSQSETAIYAEGDRLADGWTIHRIDPAEVLLRREGEERRLQAFNAGEVDNDT